MHVAVAAALAGHDCGVAVMRPAWSRHRQDGNQGPLVRLAEGIGAHLERCGPLDWWCYWRGVWVPVEIKRPERRGHKDEYTKEQILFLARCKERGAPVWTWRTAADVLASLNARQSA